MKRMVKVLLVVAITLSIMASCSQKDEGGSTGIPTVISPTIGSTPSDTPADEVIPTTTEPEETANQTAYDKTSEVIEIPSFDGYALKGRLTIPAGDKDVSKLVIFVNGSGANTYVNRRTGFDYFDFYADEFSDRGVAFFSYSTRGCEIGDEPPMYVDINEEEYQTYLPSSSVEDIYHMIRAIKENERLKDCKVYLLGSSEGTIIAPLVAKKYPASVDALFLAGYVNKNLKDILIWQNNGGSSMVWYREQFAADEQGRIDKAAYEADPNGVLSTILQDINFEDVDENQDGYITEDDFTLRINAYAGYSSDDVLSAIERRDDEWLKNNYGGGLVPLTSAWFLEYFALPSNGEILPTLDLPIAIFHGTLDQNVDVRDVYTIENQFKELGKSNLTVRVFKGHDHGLNYTDIFNNDEMSEGHKALFEAISNIE